MNGSIFHILCILEHEHFISEVMLNTFLKAGKKKRKRTSQREMASIIQTVKDQIVRNTRKFCLVPEQEPLTSSLENVFQSVC